LVKVDEEPRLLGRQSATVADDRRAEKNRELNPTFSVSEHSGVGRRRPGEIEQLYVGESSSSPEPPA